MMNNNNTVATATRKSSTTTISFVFRENTCYICRDINGEVSGTFSPLRYNGNIELGLLVLIHNEIKAIRKNGIETKHIQILLPKFGSHICTGKEPDKSDKLRNWIELDERKDKVWKAICSALLNEIQHANNVSINNGSVEPLFRIAWNELNKVVPRKQKVNGYSKFNKTTGGR